MVLYHCHFEIGLCSAKEGHDRLGRIETELLARTFPIGNKVHTNAHRRDALCPSPKIQKQAAFGIMAEGVGLISAVCVASRRSNFVLLTTPSLEPRPYGLNFQLIYRASPTRLVLIPQLMAEGVGLISA